ncbi:MAG: hypothetical protein KU37_05520 [Sulfuricurvum sp. PC08-66]|nr:MAG: hypothetical protein KU37_05520 [Sulfuricurvum sp. PC08-66]
MDLLLETLPEIATLAQAKALLAAQIPLTKKIENAISLAHEAHSDQLRKSGEPYIIHPIIVSAFVAQLSNEESMVIAAILHDTVEDTTVSIDTILEQFGSDVAHLVEGLTKIVEIREEVLQGSTAQSALTKSALSFRKMLIASTKDVRVLIVKLCDRLHNMMTLDALPLAKQQRIAEETMVVYAPIAHRLGVSMLKNRLEDLSFRYLLPNEYAKIDTFFKSHDQDFSGRLNNFIEHVRQLLLKEGFVEEEFRIVGRVKHHYSTYLKIQRKGISIEEVLDLLAIRILVQRPIDCYRVQGVIHLAFKPLMARFKDYICAPKENGYQTIHTTVFDNRLLFEVQIRTFEMHNTAELGVAAHWKYKTGGHSINLEWLNNLSNQSENVDAFMDLAAKDLFSEDITVFSPRGDVFTLPRGSVALDFAYTIHTDVGALAKDAYINKSKATLLTELKNGDLVEIKTGDKTLFRCTWIDTVKTSKARHALLHYCAVRSQEIEAKVALNILGEILDRPITLIASQLAEGEFAKSYYKVANDVETLRKVLHFLTQPHFMVRRLSTFFQNKPIKLKEQKIGNFVLYHPKNISEVGFDYCCHPKQGDEIIGFKKANKVEVHQKMCDTIAPRLSKGEPMVLVRFSSDKMHAFLLIVSLPNSKGALANFLLFLAKIDVDIVSIELGNKMETDVQHCTLRFQTKESNIGWLRKKIAPVTHIIDFVRQDDIYQK